MSSTREITAFQKHISKTRSLDESIELEWKNINFSILVKDSVKSTFGKTAYKKKEILKNVSGKIQSGQLLAIMGPTGCKCKSIYA
jgi:ABC-type multidrug transport system ATPase subunit